MQSLTKLMEWLQASSLAVFIHKTAWAFTTIELVHVFAISLVIGTIAIVDLRLLGLASTKRPFTELARGLLPWTWAAFVLAMMAGSLLFISQATEYFVNTTFWIKMSVMVLAGINMLIFEFITVRGVQKWDLKPTPPLPARLAGGDLAHLLGLGRHFRSLDWLHHAAGVIERIEKGLGRAFTRSHSKRSAKTMKRSIWRSHHWIAGAIGAAEK